MGGGEFFIPSKVESWQEVFESAGCQFGMFHGENSSLSVAGSQFSA
jgi:hypothetical protein